MIDPVLKSYTSGLSVLYVEDDTVGALIIKMMLEPFFDKVYGAHNGAEGLEKFYLHKPDLVITDLMMPVMDGIAMLHEIRKEDHKTPVLLMTASLEHVHLVEAINLGVAKFLAKPIRAEALHLSLHSVTRELYLERVAEQARRQEVELLQYRNRYHSLQQELAQSKERHIARNMMEDCFLPSGECGGWLVDLLQMPRDIMSGDCYSIIPSGNNKLLIFMADAMGHGLSASVTSMITTAFFNHSAIGYDSTGSGFSDLAGSTMLFAERNLLEEEVFSGLVMELDPVKGVASFVSCGMPPLLVVRNGEVERVRGNNPPVSAYSSSIKLQKLALDGVSDILLATDGLIDVVMLEGGSYREKLPDDLCATSTAAELFAQYSISCDDTDNDDDITLIRLISIGTGNSAIRSVYCAPGTVEGISGLQEQVREQLEKAGACGERLDNLELALSEVLLNAFEHGCLQMGANKQRLMIDGTYDNLIMAAEADNNKQISLTLTILPHTERLQVWIEVTDPGAGFDPVCRFAKNMDSSATSGRGFIMMKRSVDLVRRSPVGNRVVMMQMFDM